MNKRTSIASKTRHNALRRLPVAKHGRSSVSKLKKKLWTVFAAYIKKRDNNICFTCGRKCEGSGAHAGHFIPKSTGGLALYFHEENVHCQCFNCNINLGGNQYIYGEKLGPDMVAALRSIRQRIFKPTEEWYRDMIKDYSERD